MSFPHSYRAQWVYSPIDGRIYHSEFHHDAAMDLTGDFENDEQKTAFAEKLCALLNAQSGPNSGWIPVGERLPEIGQSVALVHVHRWEACGGDMERNVHDTGYLSEIHGQKFWSVRGERAQSVSAFTHWMPLPDRPSDATPCAPKEKA